MDKTATNNRRRTWFESSGCEKMGGSISVPEKSIHEFTVKVFPLLLFVLSIITRINSSKLF